MKKQIEKFEEFIETHDELRRLHYDGIPSFVKQALYFEVDKEDARAEMHSRYVGKTERKDRDKRFDGWWAQIDGKTKTISQYREDEKKTFAERVKEAKSESHVLNEAQKSVNRELAFVEKMTDLKNKTDCKKWIEEKKRKKWDKTSSFMLNLFDEDDIIWVSDKPISDDVTHEMKDMLSWSKKDESLSRYSFFSINSYRDDSARKKSNIKRFRYALFESDSLEQKEQLLLWIDLIKHGLPVKTLVHSGGKSIHCLVKVPESIKNLEDYEEYVNDIFGTFSLVKPDIIDKSCKNPDRLSRIPFGTRDGMVEQKLLYLQDDESMLQNDARDVVTAWCKDILAKENSSLEVTESDVEELDEIDDDELLSTLKDKEEVCDIWDDGCRTHTLMKSSHYNKDGTIIKRWEDKEWTSDRSFYNYMQQLLEKQYGIKLEQKELRQYKIKYKTAEKYPFVGKRAAVKRDIVNTFIPGWLYEALRDESIPSELNEPLEQLIYNLFGEDENAKAWTLQWMREYMHTFNAIASPVFWEIPGSGKSMFAEAFGDAVGDWIDIPLKNDDVQFNAWQDHTVIICEESSSGSKREGKDWGDKLKNMITGIYATIEAKGKDPVKRLVKNCFIFNANVSEQIPPVFIEDDDRRYTIVRNDNARNLIDIWTRDDFDKWDSGLYQKQLMKWIYNLPKDDTVNVRKGLDSVWKQEIVKMSKNNVEVALIEIAESYRGFISCADLIEKMRREYGLLNDTARANGNILGKLGYNSVIKTINGNSIRGYEFNVNATVDVDKTDESKVIIEDVDDFIDELSKE